MKYSINKIIAAAMALIMNISYIPGVEAEDIFHIIKNEDDVRKLTETLDSLTESDIQSLGIDTGIYKLIKERDYVSERIIEKGFDTVEEFRDAFNEAVDTLTYTVEYPVNITKFSGGSYSEVGNDESNILISRTYLYYTAAGIENYEYLCRLDLRFTSDTDEVPDSLVCAYSNEENSGDWSAYDSSMEALAPTTVTNKDGIHRFAVSFGGLTNNTFTVKTKNKAGIKINLNGADDELKPALIGIYDKTAQIADECKMTPESGSEDIETHISELCFNWKKEIDTDLFNKENIKITDTASGENFEDFDIEIINATEQKIKFGSELMSEHKYIIEFNNLCDINGEMLVNRSFNFKTKGIIKYLRPELNNILSKNGETEIKTYAVYESGTVKEVDANYSTDSDGVITLNGNKLKADNCSMGTLKIEFDGIETEIPVYVQAKNITENFENYEGASSEYKHSGSCGIEGTNEIKNIIDCKWDSCVAEGWFYDDMADGKNGGISLLSASVGINTEISQTEYVVNGKASGILRENGWHKVTFEVAEKIKLYIDCVAAGEFEKSGAGSISITGNQIWFDDLGFYYIKNSDPIINGLKISGIESNGTIGIGKEIKAEYTYFDEDGDEENGSEFGFYCADTKDGDYKLIASGIKEYTFKTGEYIGKYIKFIIVPKNSISDGKRYETEAYRVELGDSLKTIIKKINSGNVYAVRDIICEYYDILGIDIDEINLFKNPLYIYDGLVEKNFSVPEGISEAIKNSIAKNIISVKSDLADKAVAIDIDNNMINDVTGIVRQSTYRYRLLINKKIKYADALKGLAFSAYSSPSYNEGHMTGYTCEPLPENSDYSVYDGFCTNTVLKFNESRPVKIIESDGNRYTYEIPEQAYKNIKDEFTLFITNTDNRMMYLNGASENQRPYYIIKYDKSALDELQMKSSPYNYEEEINPELSSISVNWNMQLADGVWDKSNVRVYNDENGNELDFSLAQNGIELNEKLSPESTYVVEVNNIKDADGNEWGSKKIKFTTSGIYNDLYIKTKTSLSLNETADISAVGILSSGNEKDIRYDTLKITSDNENTAYVQDGKIYPKHRGTAVITVVKDNYDGSSAEKKFVLSVYCSNSNESFEETGTLSSDVSYSGNYSITSNNSEQKLISASDAENTEAWYFDNGLTTGYIKCGDITVNLTSGAGLWHQVLFMQNGENVDIYIDGVIKESKKGAVGDIYACADKAYFDNCNANNIIGTVCTAENVVIRGGNRTGDTLEGFYGYADKDGDIEENSELIWEISSGENGAYSKLADGNKITVLSSYEGKYIRFSVTPKNFYDVGETVHSTPILISKSTQGGGGTTGGSGNWAGNVSATAKPTEKPQTDDFADVPQSHWAYNSVMKLRKSGIINGKSERNFEPNDNVTRAEFAKMIVLAMGKSEKKYENIFSDVTSGHWSSGYIQTLYDEGIINGYDGMFMPDKSINREECVKIIMGAFEKNSSDKVTFDETAFNDEYKISDWALEYVKMAVSLGIIKGVDGNNFAPQDNTTRAQAAVIIDRFMNAVN